jgi:tetratricopeptide (TPR) repeat protein
MHQHWTGVRGLALCSALALTGCAIGGRAPERTQIEPQLAPATTPIDSVALATDEAAGRPQPIDTKAAATYHILVGELAVRRNQSEVAARAFLAALRSVPDLDLAMRATQLALQAGDDVAALEAANIWLQLDPQDGDAREVILRVHLINDRLDEALPQALAVVDGHAAGTEEGFRHLGLLLARVPTRLGPSALELMEQVRERRTDRSGSAIAYGGLALRFDELDIAEKAAQEAIAENPADQSGALLLAGIKVRRGDIIEAITLAEDAFALQPKVTRGDLRMTFARVLLEAGAAEPAAKMLETAIKDDPDLVDARYMLGAIAMQNEDWPAAERWFKSLIGTTRQQEAAMQLGQLAQQDARFEEALGYYSGITRGPAAFDALTRSAVVLARLDRLHDARQLLQRVRDELPQAEQQLIMIEVELLVNAGDHAEALQFLNESIDASPDDPDLRYARALAYERAGDFGSAEADLRKVLDDNENDARALNALGYLLVVEGKQLDEARDLIDRALVIEPEDPAIMDSKGWLLFKQGDPNAALPWLQRAYAAYPDPEVAAHLGEVLWVLGRENEARRVWDSALMSDAEHPVLTQTLNRFAPEK